MNNVELKALVGRVKGRIRITKVSATRSVKTGRGDFFAGADMDLTLESDEDAPSGMTLTEAKVAQSIVSMQADIAAYEAARANSAITDEEFNTARMAIRANYGRLLKRALLDD